MESTITSNQNKLIKFLKKLRLKKYREQYNQFIIEGKKICLEALQYLDSIEYAVFSINYSVDEETNNIFNICNQRNINIQVVTENIFYEISETDSPQGVMMVLSKIDVSMDIIEHKNCNSIIVLDNVCDPGNLGTIIRTADAFKIDAVVLSTGCVDLYNGKVIRATMGSMFHIPIIRNIDLIHKVDKLKDIGFTLVGTDPYAKMAYYNLPKFLKLGIIIGNEANGISNDIKDILDYNASIPMPGKSESLNAGIAAALFMYELAVKK